MPGAPGSFLFLVATLLLVVGPGGAIVASLLLVAVLGVLVAMPGVLLIVMPQTPSSVLAPTSDAWSP